MSSSASVDPHERRLRDAVASAQARLDAYLARAGAKKIEAVSAGGPRRKALLRGGALVPLKDAASQLGVHERTVLRWGITVLYASRRYVRREKLEKMLPEDR